MHNKPELLLPAGKVESFFAAIEGGADAVYLGLRKFNARNRATNLSFKQIQAAVKLAKSKNVKVYIVLNTVVKNSEIKEIVEVLHFLNFINADALIIQDWGVYYLAKKYFPNLPLHASTQMGNHNSHGASYCKEKGFERVVVARELTIPEVTEICKKSNIEIELFIHGALCYSFSGMCLFSSYLGGSGANRGLCAQPCRRSFSNKKGDHFLFSLNDNQQLELIPELEKIGVASLKVEGRMKSEDYVYQVAKAYRMAIDSPQQIPEASKLLDFDFGRPKTGYFLSGDVSDALSGDTATGKLIGKVIAVTADTILIEANPGLQVGFRIRIYSPGEENRVTFKIKEVHKQGDYYAVFSDENKVKPDDLVFLTAIKEKKFPSKIDESSVKKVPFIKRNLVEKVFADLNQWPSSKKADEVYVRIASMSWMRKIYLNDINGLYLNLPQQEFKDFDAKVPFIQKNKQKIFIELPRFIAEKSLGFYEQKIKGLANAGISNFVISHLSQLKIIPKGVRVHTNENVYAYNDAAIKTLKSEEVINFTYPLENDFENLSVGKNRDGLVPVYFYPELFFSRMPIELDKEAIFKDRDKSEFKHIKKDGLTIIVPGIPVSLLQFKKQFSEKGFSRFFIDISYDSPSKHLLKKLINRLIHSEQVQPSTSFNFKIGLK